MSLELVIIFEDKILILINCNIFTSKAICISSKGLVFSKLINGFPIENLS